MKVELVGMKIKLVGRIETEWGFQNLSTMTLDTVTPALISHKVVIPQFHISKLQNTIVDVQRYRLLTTAGPSRHLGAHSVSEQIATIVFQCSYTTALRH